MSVRYWITVFFHRSHPSCLQELSHGRDVMGNKGIVSQRKPRLKVVQLIPCGSAQVARQHGSHRVQHTCNITDIRNTSGRYQNDKEHL